MVSPAAIIFKICERSEHNNSQLYTLNSQLIITDVKSDRKEL